MAYVERSNKFPSLELPKRFDDILHCTLHGENCSSSGIILFKTYPRSLPHVSAWRSISQSYFTDFRSVPRPDSSDYQGNDFAPPANFKAFRKIVGGLIAGAIEYYNYMRLRASEATAANNRVLDAHKLTQIPQQSTTSLAVIHRKSRPCTRPRSLETRPELHGVSECPEFTGSEHRFLVATRKIRVMPHTTAIFNLDRLMSAVTAMWTLFGITSDDSREVPLNFWQGNISDGNVS